MKKIRKRLQDKKIIKRVSLEELLLSSTGYGVSQIEICKNNPLFEKTLGESRLRQKGVVVLSVERRNEHITNPPTNLQFQLNDKLVCFGRLEDIRTAAYATREAKEISKEEDAS